MLGLSPISCLLGHHKWVYDHDDFWAVSVFKCSKCGESTGRSKDIREPHTGAEIFTKWDGLHGMVTYSLHGDEVGVLTFTQDGDAIRVKSIHVRYENRRNGIATRMTYEAMRLTGTREAKTDLITEEGEALVKSLPELELKIAA
jgi:predicted GNAT family acetyltransferase